MRNVCKMKTVLAGLVLGLICHSQSIFACAACYGGKTDSPLAQGMNAGIFSLLAIVGCVLCGVAAFGIYLARRSMMMSAAVEAEQSLKVTQELS
ncbi:MAG: hypothetical protein JWQ71_2857 [Pedosphaera sp.]|nr:hypothetical protein [Pedosphaera sp.]